MEAAVTKAGGADGRLRTAPDWAKPPSPRQEKRQCGCSALRSCEQIHQCALSCHNTTPAAFIHPRTSGIHGHEPRSTLGPSSTEWHAEALHSSAPIFGPPEVPPFQYSAATSLRGPSPPSPVSLLQSPHISSSLIQWEGRGIHLRARK